MYSRLQENPTLEITKLLKHVLRYVKYMKNLSLVYTKNKVPPVKGIVDASCAKENRS